MLERARREAAERDDAVRKAEAAVKEAQRIVREAEALRRAEEEELDLRGRGLEPGQLVSDLHVLPADLCRPSVSHDLTSR